MSRIVMKLEVEVEVDLDAWGLTYGQEQDEAWSDARDHVPNLVQGHLESTFEQVANGTKLTEVHLLASHRHPAELTAEVLGEFAGNTVDYPYVRAWGDFMGSYPSYINEQVELARRTHAPADAIYHRDNHGDDNGWHRFADIKNPSAINSIRRLLEKGA